MRSAESPEGSKSAADPRRESLAERDDRNIAELLQELRVVSLGVQVLFGFLLSLPFTARFSRLDTGQRDLYLASLVLSAVAVVLLLGPVAYHRIVFRSGLKESLVKYTNIMAILGLVAVGAAVLTAVLLVTGVVAGMASGAVITAVIACVLVSVWFAWPLGRRGGELSPSQLRPGGVPLVRCFGSGISHAQRRRDVLDRLFLRRGYLIPFLPVGRSDLVGHGEDEVPVVVALLDGRLVFQQRRRVAQTVDPLIPELLGIVNFPALHARLLRHDLVEKLTLAVLGTRLGVDLRHRHRLPEHSSVRRRDDEQARGRWPLEH
jgi:hypothetical protein